MSAGRLQDKSIVITGAASGLGRAMALTFAAEGADVVVGDVRPDPREGGEPTVYLIERAGGSGIFVEADASRWDDIDRLVTTAVERRGRLDVIVNNAIVAGRHSKGLLETEPEDWDAIMDVGLRGVFLCCKRAVQQMLGQQPVAEARGRIINISSQHGMIGAPGHVAYCTAKGGVINLAVPGLRRVHVRERHQPAGGRRVDGLLIRAPASIHHQVAAAHVAGLVCQERHRRGNVLGAAQACERRA